MKYFLQNAYGGVCFFKKYFLGLGLCFVGQSLINNQLDKAHLEVYFSKYSNWKATTVEAFYQKICPPLTKILVGAPQDRTSPFT